MTPAWRFCGSVGGGFQKRDNGLCLPFCLGKSCSLTPALMPDTSVLSRMPLVPFKLLPWGQSPEGVSLGKSVCGFFKGNSLGLQEFLLPTQSLLVFAARCYGDLLSWH